MPHLIYRHRRRLALYVLGVFAIVGLYLVPAADARYDLSNQADVFAFQTFSAIIGIICLPILAIPLLIIRFAPGWRGMIEMLPVGLPLGAFANWIANLFDHIPIVAKYEGLIFWAILMSIIYGVPRVRWFRVFRVTSRASYRSFQSPAQLWALHWPDPTTIATHWSTLTTAITADPDDPSTKHISYDFGNGPVTYRLAFHTQSSPKHFAYDMYAMGTMDQTGYFETKFTAYPGYTQVDLVLQARNLSPFSWLHAWCDDVMGQQVDHHVAVETGQDDYSTIGVSHRRAKAAKKPAPREQTA